MITYRFHMATIHARPAMHILRAIHGILHDKGLPSSVETYYPPHTDDTIDTYLVLRGDELDQISEVFSTYLKVLQHEEEPEVLELSEAAGLDLARAVQETQLILKNSRESHLMVQENGNADSDPMRMFPVIMIDTIAKMMFNVSLVDIERDEPTPQTSDTKKLRD